VIDPLVKATIVKIPVSLFESNGALSDDVLKAYYDAHASDFYGKKKVRLEYLELKTRDAYQSDRDKLANLTFENPDSLTVAAQALNLPILETEYFSAEGGDTPLTQNPAVLTVAFDPESLKSHANSDLISISPTDAVVIRVVEEQSPRPRSFEEVKSEIQTLLLGQQAEKRAKMAAEQLLQAKNFVDEAKSAGFTVIPQQIYRENEKTLSPVIKKALFDQSTGLKAKGSRIDLLDEDSGWVVVEVESGGSAKPSSTQLYESTIRLPGIWSAWEYRAYEDELIHDATIKTNL
jgi:peptidyl-prolyl cis-trans isomerase D